MRGGGGARPRGTGPRCVWTPRSLLGWDPDLGCAAVLGFLGHVSIHSLRHSDLHGHPTAQFCARACSRPCVRRLVSLAGAGGAGGAALRSRCGFYSGFMSAGSIGLRGHMPCPGHHDLVLRLRHPSTAAFTFCAAALRILHPRPAPRSPCACPTSPPRAPPMQTPPPCARQGRGPAGWGVPRGGWGVGVSKATVSSSRGLTPCLGQPFCKAKAKPTVRFVQHRRLVALT